MSRWYRAYEGTVTDSKLSEVALIAGTSRSVVIATWHAVLENCAGLNDGGRFDIPPRRVAAALAEPVAIIEQVFAGLDEVGMTADGAACAWSKRQFESDSSTERSRKHREQQRNADATLQQRDATPPETETETETKIEKKVYSRVANATARTEAFEAFWKSYPARKGDNPKAPARKVFEAAVKQGADPQAIISGVKAASSKNRDKIGTEFIPQAAKWLRDRRWEDYLVSESPPSGEGANRVYARFSSPQLDAWEQHDLANGIRRPRDKHGGWWFDTEWPPDYESKSEAA